MEDLKYLAKDPGMRIICAIVLAIFSWCVWNYYSYSHNKYIVACSDTSGSLLFYSTPSTHVKFDGGRWSGRDYYKVSWQYTPHYGVVCRELPPVAVTKPTHTPE